MKQTSQRSRRSQGSPRWVLLLVALFFAFYALQGPILMAWGARSTAVIEKVRRESGGHIADRPNEYYWNVSYRFQADGEVRHGSTRVVGTSYKSGTQVYKVGQQLRVYYWKAVPQFSVLEKEAEPGWHTVALLGLAGLLFWFSKRPGSGKRGRSRAKGRGAAHAGRKQEAPIRGVTPPMGPDETRKWILSYRKQSAWYAWLFFVVIVGIVLGVIWWELGEINRDVLYSVGFFAVLTFFLAIWSRSRTNHGWQGVVTRKWVKEVKVRYQDRPTEVRYQPRLEVRTDRHGVQQLRLSDALFEHFAEGDSAVKIPGFDFPEKVDLPEDGTRVCICCGSLVEAGQSHCHRCRGPIPDHTTLLEMSR